MLVVTVYGLRKNRTAGGFQTVNLSGDALCVDMNRSDMYVSVSMVCATQSEWWYSVCQ